VHNGRLKWVPLVSFASKAARDNWRAQVVDAIYASHPNALA
jgi:hypothetical protein